MMRGLFDDGAEVATVRLRRVRHCWTVTSGCRGKGLGRIEMGNVLLQNTLNGF